MILGQAAVREDLKQNCTAGTSSSHLARSQCGWEIPGEEHLVGNEGFLAMESLPCRILLVGGGYIAAEFSHIAARAGTQVTDIQRGPRMLRQFGPELVEWIMDAFSAAGIDVQTNTTVTAVEQDGAGFTVRGESNGEEVAIPADVVVHAAGRAPALERLNIAAANLLKGNHAIPDYRGVPSVAFTIPPIAAVGMSEEEARASCLRYKVKSNEPLTGILLAGLQSRCTATSRSSRTKPGGYWVLT